MMITKIGPFELGQPIDPIFQQFKEVSAATVRTVAQNHQTSLSHKQPRHVLFESGIDSSNGNKTYETHGIPFMDIKWNGNISTTKNRISDIAIFHRTGQFGEPTTQKDIKCVFKKMLSAFESQIGKAQSHAFLSKLYIWQLSEETIVLKQSKARDIHEVGLLLKLNGTGLKNASRRMPLAGMKPLQLGISDIAVQDIARKVLRFDMSKHYCPPRNVTRDLLKELEGIVLDFSLLYPRDTEIDIDKKIFETMEFLYHTRPARVLAQDEMVSVLREVVNRFKVKSPQNVRELRAIYKVAFKKHIVNR